MSKLIINEKATRFFIYAYLGVDINDEITEDTREMFVEACVRRAYLDMCRTLRTKDIENWSAKKGEIMGKFVDPFCKNKTVENMKKDAWKMLDNYNDIFTCGQKQKWINMTLKYMWLIGLIKDNEVCKLDVPIDRLIFRKLYNNEEHNGKVWSRIDDNDYSKIKGDIIKEKGNKTVIEWEFDAWIAQAKKENKNK